METINHEGYNGRERLQKILINRVENYVFIKGVNTEITDRGVKFIEPF